MPVSVAIYLQAESTSLKKQVKSLSTDKKSLEQTLDAAEAVIQKHKYDYEDCQVSYCKAVYTVRSIAGACHVEV